MSRAASKAVVATLRAIAARSGGILKAEEVVESARDPDSPLHGSFTWDDTEAAAEYRLDQARRLIRVCVEYLPNDKSEKPVRVFVSMRSDRASGEGYRRLVDVMNDDDMRASLLADALNDMEQFRDRYKRLVELTEVFEAMDVVAERSKPARAKK